MITGLILGGIVLLIVVFTFPKRQKNKMYAFQVYDNLGKYVYIKRVNARDEIEAGEKIKKYTPKDYTYEIIWNN